MATTLAEPSPVDTLVRQGNKVPLAIAPDLAERLEGHTIDVEQAEDGRGLGNSGPVPPKVTTGWWGSMRRLRRTVYHSSETAEAGAGETARRESQGL